MTKVLGSLAPVIRPIVNLFFVLAVLVVLWMVLIDMADVSGATVRTPSQVFDLFWNNTEIKTTGATNAGVWSAVLPPLWRTLLDAGIGFVAGLLAASLVATGTYLSKGFEAATMPAAMVVRTVPLVAMAPVITLVFGNGFATVAVMSGVVVFFPALVTISFGLRSLSPQMKDVVTVYGGTNWDVLRRVAWPTALPGVFAAIRISVPGAITGALIAEFYTTSDSVGKAVNQSLALYRYDMVWSLLVIVTVASVILYVIAQLIERLMLTRFGMEKSLS